MLRYEAAGAHHTLSAEQEAQRAQIHHQQEQQSILSQRMGQMDRSLLAVCDRSITPLQQQVDNLTSTLGREAELTSKLLDHQEQRALRLEHTTREAEVARAKDLAKNQQAQDSLIRETLDLRQQMQILGARIWGARPKSRMFD